MPDPTPAGGSDIVTHPADPGGSVEAHDGPSVDGSAGGAKQGASGTAPSSPEGAPAASSGSDTAPKYPNEPGLLDNVADKLGFRGWLEAHPSMKQIYRVCVGVLGFIVLVAGIIMIPFPGPGWLVVIAGLAILATEFAWAERLLTFTKKHVLSWTRWVNRQPIWIRLLIGLATAAFVYGVIVVMLHITGVPDWVPDWIPLWH